MVGVDWSGSGVVELVDVVLLVAGTVVVALVATVDGLVATVDVVVLETVVSPVVPVEPVVAGVWVPVVSHATPSPSRSRPAR